MNVKNQKVWSQIIKSQQLLPIGPLFFYKDGEQTEQNLSPKIDIGIQDSTPPKSTNHCMQSFLFKTNYGKTK